MGPQQIKKKQSPQAVAVPVLYVGVPSQQADHTALALEARGMRITRAENVCYAEIYADAQRFVGAVYDQSLRQEEQVSLAQVMRIRWPWMRILRWVPADEPLLHDELFDWSVYTQSEVAACAASRLTS